MNKIRKIVSALVVAGLLIVMPYTIYGAIATVTFGSNWYEVDESTETFPVGVYIDTGKTTGDYYIEVSYDTSRLEYLSGANEEKDGVLILEGEGIEGETRYWLEFKVLSGGEAFIKVDSAEIYMVGNENLFTVKEFDEAPIHLAGEDTAALATEEVTETEEKATELVKENTITENIVPSSDSSSMLDRVKKGLRNSMFYLYLVLVVLFVACCYIFIRFLQLLHFRNRKRKLREKKGNVTVENKKRVNYRRSTDMEKEESQQKDIPEDAGKETVSFSEALLEEEEEEVEDELPKNLADAVEIPVVPPVSEPMIEKSEAKEEEKTIEKKIEHIEEKKAKPVIQIKDVCMTFKLATSSTSGIKDYLIQMLKHQISYREFKALDHINFDVMKGEVVGIIGTNGSGKSTLLKIVSGALKPTRGEVIVDKKRLQLLTLGTGFDQELTAKENVYLNGAIIGYTKDFIDEHYDEIVEFAELEGFMDEKVKNFSSGMVSRLGFAIATVGDAADILILDEVLSVGDVFFRQKSLKRIKEMIHGGSTVLMVSHGMGTIRDNCSKVVWIEKGVFKMIGDAKTVCAAYEKSHSEVAC